MSKEIRQGFVIRIAWCYGCAFTYELNKSCPEALKETLFERVVKQHDETNELLERLEQRVCTNRKLVVVYDNAMCEVDLSGAPDKKEAAPIGTASES